MPTISTVSRMLFIVCSTFVVLPAFAADAAKPPADSQSPCRVYVWKTYPWDDMCQAAPIWRELESAGFQVVTGAQVEINAATLRKFNAVVVTDLFSDPNLTNQKLSGEIERYAQLLDDYVRAGGSLMVFGRSMHHMSHQTATDALNQILARWGAEVLQEVVRDPGREKVQERYSKMRYAGTKNIVKDELTAGVSRIWYPNGVMVGVTSPLKLSADWKPLIKASASAVTHKLGLDANAYPRELEDQPGTAGAEPVIAAVRRVGEGRVVLLGQTSTVPFWGYKHLVWEDIATTNGINDRSDWMVFFLNSLKILATGAKTGGALNVKPIAVTDIQPAIVKDWGAVKAAPPSGKPYKGIVGASTAFSDGTGTVAEFATAAKKLGVDFVVFAEDLKTLTEANYRQLIDACRAASSAEFAAVPGVKYLDVDGNHRILIGEKCWPSAKRLVPQDRTIFGPVWYWFDAGAPMHIAYDFSHSNYPAYANLGLNAMGVRTYDSGKLVDEATACFLDNQHRGDCLAPVVVNLCRSPEALAAVTESYFVPGNSLADVVKPMLDRYPGWNEGLKVGFTSGGPLISQWAGVNLQRHTGGPYYVPGTERWRVTLKADSDVPITMVEILDGSAVLRLYRLNGPSCDISLDGLHDLRRVLVARVTDAKGRQAITGGLTITDVLFDQGQCSDRQNFMGGRQDCRTTDGRYQRLQATAMLSKATRPNVGNVQTSDPALLNPLGVDGGFGNTFGLFCPMMVRGKSWDEFRFPVFRNGFRYCSRDAIVFDLTYTHRIADDCAPWPSIESGNPWLRMEPARHFTARTTWVNFPRRINDFSPSVVEFEMDFQRAVSLSNVHDPDQGRALFWTHRLGFHHPEFRFKGLKGIEPWEASPTDTYTDNLPPLLLAANEGEASPGVQDRCSYLPTGAGETTIAAGKDASRPNHWQGALKPGDALLLHPNLGGSGGFFLLAGQLETRVELAYDWIRMYLGLYELKSFKPGDVYRSRILTLQGKFAEQDAVADWASFRDAWGVAGGKPAYTLAVKRGKVLDTRFVLECEAANSLVALSVGQAALSQRLPIKINGLSPQSTAAIVDNTRKEWLPIGVTTIEAYATHDANLGASDLVIGNIVTCDNPALSCTLLPEGGAFALDVHNPTDAPATATVAVPEGLWMIQAGKRQVIVPAGSTVRVKWDVR